MLYPGGKMPALYVRRDACRYTGTKLARLLCFAVRFMLERRETTVRQRRGKD